MIKLVVTDVDGTLIEDSTPNLYPEIVDVITKLQEKKIRFCVASGRQYPSLKNVFRQIPGDIIYIAENGAQIRYRGKDIALTAMPGEDVEEIVEQLRRYNNTCNIIVSTANGSLVESTNQDFIHLMVCGYHNVIRQVPDVLGTGDEILKVSIYQKGSIRQLGENTLIPAWEDRVKVCMAGEEWVDFMASSVDKGHALAYVQDYFRIRREETMAFGDNNNDIGLLRTAGISYAVDNARPEVKTAATGICPSYQEKGVWQIVRELLE